jgi:hypothetical protein
MPDKKWFIYVQDHHEGPFTVDEIYQGIAEGRFSREGYVWAEGMKDWLPMGQVPEFAAEPSAPPPPAPEAPSAPEEPSAAVEPAAPEETAFNAYSSSQEPELSRSPAPVAEIEDRGPAIGSAVSFGEEPVPASHEEPHEPTKTNTTIIEVGDIGTKTGISRPGLLGRAVKGPTTHHETDQTPIFVKLKPLIFAVLVLFALVGLQRLGVLRPIEERLGAIVSSLPELPDVAPAEYAELKKVVKAPLSAGPQVAVALSSADPLSPVYYVATNLPDGARFELYVEGVPQTLLSTLNFSGRLDVVTAKHLAKSQPLRYPDGKPIPRGEYTVYVMEAPTGQPDLVYKELLQLQSLPRNLPAHLPQSRRIVYSKRIFFGARDGAKDATYQQRLKEFHDGLVAKAKTELTDVSQALATLESQAVTSNATYDRMKAQKIGPAQKQSWAQMNQTWRPVEEQIVAKYAGLTPERAKADYFHSNLVLELVAVEKILSELHSTHEKLFTTGASAPQLDAQVADLRRPFEERRGKLKAAVDKALASPADPATGLPAKAEIEGAPAAASAPAAAPAAPAAASAPAATGGH